MNSTSFIRDLYSHRLSTRGFVAHRMQYEDLDDLSNYHLLPLLILSVRSADPRNKSYDCFVHNALRTAGVLVKRHGYDSNDSTHKAVVDLIFKHNFSSNIQNAFSSIWALGDLGIPPTTVRDRLECLVESAARKRDNQPVTCRSIAFRMLARLDRETARKYVDSPACQEFRETVSFLLDYYKINSPSNGSVPQELFYETEWLDFFE